MQLKEITGVMTHSALVWDPWTWKRGSGFKVQTPLVCSPLPLSLTCVSATSLLLASATELLASWGCQRFCRWPLPLKFDLGMPMTLSLGSAVVLQKQTNKKKKNNL